MSYIFYNLGQVLGITIINSLWQGLLVYLLVRLFLIAFPSTNSNKKYNVLCICLLVLGVWFAYTFYTEVVNYNWTVTTKSKYTGLNHVAAFNTYTPRTNPSTSLPFLSHYKQAIQTYLPYLSALYLISMVVNVVRLALAWQKIRIIEKQASPADALQRQVNDLIICVGIAKHVQLSFSDLIDVPCALGFIKPLLLLPVTITTQLSADEIEIILLHELAHIKNNDYLLNLIQQVIALLLFLNPFAQLISRMINVERENRCDDIVLQLAADPLTYAGTLVKLEKTRQSNLRLALAATNNKYHLFARIQRIMQAQKPVVNIKHLVLAIVIFVGSLGSVAWLDPQIKDGKITSVRGARAMAQLAAVVKKVIAPVPIHITNWKKNPQISGVKAIDSIKVMATVDTVKIKTSEKDALLIEYKKLIKDLVDNQNKLYQLPEYKQYTSIKKILDSLRNVKEREALAPELIQQAKDKQTLLTNYLRSPKVLQKQAERQRVMEAWHTAESEQPEMVAFEKEYAIKKDSVLNKVMNINNLTEEQAKKTDEYKNLINHYLDEQNVIKLKIIGRPEVKVLLDSMDKISNFIFQDPEYVALREKTKASKEYMAAISQTGPEVYETAAKEALDKLKNSPVYKKYMEDMQKDRVIIQQLKQMP